METSPTYDVFLSYSRSDAVEVQGLAQLLRASGLRIWFDQWELVPGQVWADAVADAARSSLTALVCIGPSGRSTRQWHELSSVLGDDLASRGPHRVIPILLPGADAASLPNSLHALSWVDFRNGLEVS